MSTSLWLRPPPDTPLANALQALITSTIPSLFPFAATHNFIPHITLTSGLPQETQLPGNPRAYLAYLGLPPCPDKITIQSAEAGDPFFKKLTIRIEQSDELAKLAEVCRANGVLIGDGQAQSKAKEWVDREYKPHLSLM